jgi:hypothetical protein
MTEPGDEPKSALELAMERLGEGPRGHGGARSAASSAPPSPTSAGHDAKLAEREIFHRDALRKARDADAVAVLEEEYRRDRERLSSERDRKVAEIRAG